MVVKRRDIIPVTIADNCMAARAADAKKNRAAGIQVRVYHAVQPCPNCRVESIDAIGVFKSSNEGSFSIEK